MRFAVAVLGAGIAQVFPYLRLDQWIGAGGALALLYIGFAALGAGFFAGRRGAAAGALSVLVGAFLYAVVAGLPQPGADPGAFATFFLRIPIAVFSFFLRSLIATQLHQAFRPQTAPVDEFNGLISLHFPEVVAPLAVSVLIGAVGGWVGERLVPAGRWEVPPRP